MQFNNLKKENLIQNTHEWKIEKGENGFIEWTLRLCSILPPVGETVAEVTTTVVRSGHGLYLEGNLGGCWDLRVRVDDVVVVENNSPVATIETSMFFLLKEQQQNQQWIYSDG